MPRGFAAPSTSLMVRDHLREVGEDSVYGTFKAVKATVEALPKAYVPPTYASIRRLFYILRKLDLIEFVESTPSSRGGYYERRVYRLVPEKAEADEWVDPSSAYYNPAYWKKRKKMWIPSKMKVQL